MGERERLRRFVALSALGLASTITVTGCTAGGAAPPSATASATVPDVDSDEAILAAAIDVYTRYSAAFDVALSKLPAESDYSQLHDTVTEIYWETLMEEFDAGHRDWYQTGSTAFEHATLIDSRVDRDGVEATVRVCVDTSRVHLKDAVGNETHSDERTLRFPMEVTFEGSSTGAIVVSDAYNVEGGPSCAD